MTETNSPVFSDYAAATPLDERVLRAMQPYESQLFFNPSSPYLAAEAVRTAVDDARSRISKIIGSKPGEIVFTAGATESVNMAIWGVCSADEYSHLVTSRTEHQAVLRASKRHRSTIVEVEAQSGLINTEAIIAAITDDTRLVSIGLANGETGTIQPVHDISKVINSIRRDRLSRGVRTPLVFHTDASQATGMLDVNVERLGVDLMTLNAGKCYGPKQVGLLYVRSPLVLEPLILGGGQESGLRSGTENVPGIVGFAKAFQIADATRKSENDRLMKLRRNLIESIDETVPNTRFIGHPMKHLPNILLLAWRGLDGERIVYGLDAEGVMVSTGSACAANKGTRSHTLEAIGLEEEIADGSIRISLGRYTTETDVRRAAQAIARVVSKERSV